MRYLGFFVGFLCLLGCSRGPDVYPVSGQVVFEDGQMVDSGLIEFRNVSQGLNARGRIQQDGTFRLTTFTKHDGAIAGKHQAIIVQQIVAEVALPREKARQPEASSQPQTHRAHRKVDSKFASYDSSPLEFTVEPNSDNRLVIKVR